MKATAALRERRKSNGEKRAECARMGVFAQIRDGFRTAFGSPRVRALLGLTGTVVAAASVFYRLVEGWPLVDAVYFSVMTIATVGFGDFAPRTTLGKLFTIGYVVCGLGLFVATVTAIADSVLRELRDTHGA